MGHEAAAGGIAAGEWPGVSAVDHGHERNGRSVGDCWIGQVQLFHSERVDARLRVGPELRPQEYITGGLDSSVRLRAIQAETTSGGTGCWTPAGSRDQL